MSTNQIGEIKVPMTNAGLFPQAFGKAEFEIENNGEREFEVEVEDIPVGSYDLVVDGVQRGSIMVQAEHDGNEGEIEFSNFNDDDELPFDFDPRGQLIEVFNGSEQVFSIDFPTTEGHYDYVENEMDDSDDSDDDHVDDNHVENEMDDSDDSNDDSVENEMDDSDDSDDDHVENEMDDSDDSNDDSVENEMDDSDDSDDDSVENEMDDSDDSNDDSVENEMDDSDDSDDDSVDNQTDDSNQDITDNSGDNNSDNTVEETDVSFGGQTDDNIQATEAENVFAADGAILFTGAGNDIVDAISAEGAARVYSGSGDDILVAGKGNRLLGQSGDDEFFTTDGGDNILYGGTGNDVFNLANAEIPAGVNEVRDFTQGEDILGVNGFTDISFEDISLTQDGNDTVLGLSGEDFARLSGVDANNLGAEDFTFTDTNVGIA